MSKIKIFFVSVLVLVVAFLGYSEYKHLAATQGESAGSGNVNTNVDQYPNGLQLGSEVILAKGGVMGAGQNQASWKNTTARVVFIDATRVSLQSSRAGFAPAASSTFVFYSATSSTATFSNDYAAPSSSYRPLDGAIVATSTGYITIAATSTTQGTKGVVAVQPGEYYVVTMQSLYGCKVNGTCETATSTNRGFNPQYYFRAAYRP